MACRPDMTASVQRLLSFVLLLGISLSAHAASASAPNRIGHPIYSLRVSNPVDSAATRFDAIDTTWLKSIDRRGIAAYEAVEPAGGAGFLDNAPIVLLRKQDKWRLHLMNRPHGKPRPLPALPFRFSFGIFPTEAAGERWIIGQDAGGDEEFRLHAYTPRNGKVTPWPAPPGRASQVVFAPGGERFLYAHNPPGETRWDIRLGHWPQGYLQAAQRSGLRDSMHDSLRDTLHDTLYYRAQGIWSPADLDATGRHALLIRTVSAFHTELHALDSTRLTRLPPLDAASTVTWAKWLATSDADTSRIALIADGPSEYSRLYLLVLPRDTTPGATAPLLTPLSPPCDCEVEAALALPSPNLPGETRPHRPRLVFALNHQAESKLFFIDTLGATPKPILGLPSGVLASMRSDATGRKLVVVLSHFGTPGDLYVVDLHRVSRGQTAATLWMKAPGLERLPKPRYSLAAARRMQVTPKDPLPPPQNTVPLWLVTPQSALAAPKRHGKNALPSPAPLLLRLHGGPELQARPGYDPLDRYLGEQWGFAIAYPDVRGSSGYGRAYLAADDHVRRPKVLRDVQAVIDTLRTMPELDASRFAVSGRSYGGYLAQAAAIAFGGQDEKAGHGVKGEQGRPLRAAISGVGISDFPRFLAMTKSYRADLRRMEYGDERDSTQRTFLDSLSPLNHMSKLDIPLMLLHGENDPRVPYEQSELVFQSLAQRGHPVLFMTLHDEGHAARAKEARLAQMRVSAHFLLTTLHAQKR
jgi:dienelactone hydrolase